MPTSTTPFAQISVDEDMITFDFDLRKHFQPAWAPFAIDEGSGRGGRTGWSRSASSTPTPARCWSRTSRWRKRQGNRGRATFAISGVPGTGAEIAMDWTGTIGAKEPVACLPTGNAVDKIELRDGRVIELTLVDVANPCFWLRAPADIGPDRQRVGGTTSTTTGPCSPPSRRSGARRQLMYGFLRGTGNAADDQTPGLPMVGMIARGRGLRDDVGRSGSTEADMHLRTRLIAVNRLHEAMAAAGAISVARGRLGSADRSCTTLLGDARTDPFADRSSLGHHARPGAEPWHRRRARGSGFDLLGVSRTSRADRRLALRTTRERPCARRSRETSSDSRSRRDLHCGQSGLLAGGLPMGGAISPGAQELSRSSGPVRPAR